jgi:hypothetical protein
LENHKLDFLKEKLNASVRNILSVISAKPGNKLKRLELKNIFYKDALFRQEMLILTRKLLFMYNSKRMEEVAKQLSGPLSKSDFEKVSLAGLFTNRYNKEVVLNRVNGSTQKQIKSMLYARDVIMSKAKTISL